MAIARSLWRYASMFAGNRFDRIEVDEHVGVQEVYGGMTANAPGTLVQNEIVISFSTQLFSHPRLESPRHTKRGPSIQE